MSVKLCDLKPTHLNHIQNIPKSYQNHIKIVSKPYQNRIKPYQNRRKTTKIKKNDQKFVPGFFLVPFFKANSLEPYQNRIKIIEGSLELKLPTIWTDEKQSRYEAERRGRLEERRLEERRVEEKE
jgi:RNase H-fold protein (predicted Holliday junction resolvase)